MSALLTYGAGTDTLRVVLICDRTNRNLNSTARSVPVPAARRRVPVRVHPTVPEIPVTVAVSL